MKYLFGYKPGKVISEQTTPTTSTGKTPQGPGEVIVKTWDKTDRPIKFPFIKNQETYDKFALVTSPQANQVFFGGDVQEVLKNARAKYQEVLKQNLEKGQDQETAARGAQNVYDEMTSAGQIYVPILNYILTNLAVNGLKVDDYFTRISKDQFINEFNKISPIKDGWKNYFFTDAYGQDTWEGFKEKVIAFAKERIKMLGGNPDDPMKPTQTTTKPV